MQYKIKLYKNIDKIRFVLFLLAVILYAAFSTPFPRNPGLFELVVGCLVVIYIGIKQPFIVFLAKGKNVIPVWLYLIMFFYLIVPIVVSLINQWQFKDLIRDYIPLFYMFMPLFVAPILARSGERNILITMWVSVIAGLILTMRYFHDVGIYPWEVGGDLLLDSGLYLLYEPMVLFSVTFLLLYGLRMLSVSWKNAPHSLACLFLGGIVILSFVSTIQRGSIGLVLLVIALWLLINLRNKNVLLIALVGVLIIYMGQEYLGSVARIFLEKHEAVGSNNKLSELFEIISVLLGEGVFGFLFGIGWGGVYNSPSEIHVAIRFTHSMFTFFLLKTGVLGLLLFCSYFFYVTRLVLKGIGNNSIGVYASIPPLIYGLLLQPTYKTLGFGLVLSIVFAISIVSDSAVARGKNIQ